jgi:hypothetical protein
MAAYKLTIRRKGAVERARFGDLGAALAALEARLAAGAAREPGATRQVLAREYAPAEQVALRGEIAGPRGLRGGVDVRGDGSAAAYTGRLRRTVVDPRPGESAYAALARAMSSPVA